MNELKQIFVRRRSGFGHFNPLNFPFINADRYRHRPAAYFAIRNKLGASLAHIQGEGKSFPTMRTLNGNRIIHGIAAIARKNAGARLKMLRRPLASNLNSDLPADAGEGQKWHKKNRALEMYGLTKMVPEDGLEPSCF